MEKIQIGTRKKKRYNWIVSLKPFLSRAGTENRKPWAPFPILYIAMTNLPDDNDKKLNQYPTTVTNFSQMERSVSLSVGQLRKIGLKKVVQTYMLHWIQACNGW